MQKLTCVLFLALTAAAVSGCVNPDTTVDISYSHISPAEAKNRLDSEAGIVLLDVRTPEEYAVIRIPGSILIPVEIIEEEALSRLPDRSAPVFIYCRSGRRSITAAEILLNLGYTNVYDLGGIIDWPYATESGESG